MVFHVILAIRTIQKRISMLLSQVQFPRKTHILRQNSSVRSFTFSYSDMPGQAELLVKRMRKALGDTRFENEWKLVTLFIGGNDLCFYCKETVRNHWFTFTNNQAFCFVLHIKNRFSPENYRNNIKTTLEILYQKMPRTLVNFVSVNNVAEVKDLHKGAMCQSLQGYGLTVLFISLC